MDPAKRVCLKNLPENCSKREIAEMVRNRTGAQPHSIDLGLDAAGNTRRYAHFSCEGAKNVLEALSAGASLRGEAVTALPARQHYSFRYAEARRKREREEEAEKTALEEFWQEKRRHFLERSNGGELPKKRVPKSFYASRQKYATVASEIARKLREEHAARKKNTGGGNAFLQPPSQQRRAGGAYQQSRETPEELLDAAATGGASSEGAATTAVNREGTVTTPQQPPAAHKGKFDKHNKKPVKGGKGKGKPAAAPAAAPAVPPPPPAPPQPTKEERKLTGLQAKLAALKEKMQRK